MHLSQTRFQKISKISIALGVASFVFLAVGGETALAAGWGFGGGGAAGSAAQNVGGGAAAPDVGAATVQNLAQTGAQKALLPGQYPCGSSPGPQLECHTYDLINKTVEKRENAIILAILVAAMNSLTYATQKIAQASANWILAGGKGGTAGFFRSTFGNFMEDVVADAGNRFIVELNNYATVAFKFNLCTPVNPLDLQLSLGVRRIKGLKKEGCDFQKIVKNFEQIQHSLETGDLFKNVKANLSTEKSDIGIAVAFHQRALESQERALNAAIKQREETRGLKDVLDTISGNIRTPSIVVHDTIRETNATGVFNRASMLQTLVFSMHAFKIGVEQLPAVFGTTFLNTLAVGGIEALMKYLKGIASTDTVSVNLLNPEAQSSAEGGRSKSIVFTDIVTPNLITTDQQDFIHELSSCTDLRGLWGCAMDQAFATGLRLFDEQGAFTVARASGLGGARGSLVFLHQEWELIPESDVKENQDPGCYQRAYCASNLAKLRFARILPIGWELAANSPSNKKANGTYTTLGEVLRSFNNCNEKGQLDAAHPWCHLIDPAWVLATPPFQCRVKGYGDSVIPGQYPVRTLECSDVVSCLKRNDAGTCIGGYGYCLSEKTVWRFNADACDEKYVSCRTYNRRDVSQAVKDGESPAVSGEQVSYLRNTIDYGKCNADTVGCKLYSTTRDTSTTSTDRWDGGITSSAFWTASGLTGPRVYFDATVEACDAANDGCTQVLKFTPGEQALNLIKNGSFETSSKIGDAPVLDGWAHTGSPLFLETKTGLASVHGSRSVEWKTPSGPKDPKTSLLTQEVSIVPLRNYVASFYARANDETKPPSPSGAVFIIEFLKKDKKTLVSGTGKKFYRNLSTCGIEISSGSVDPTVTKSSMASLSFGSLGGALSATWKRYTCEFVANDDAAFARVKVDATSAAIDAIQLEEADRATPFIDGNNTALSSNHIKLPPEELACLGDQKKDRAECGNYARMCRQTEAGCQGYTEVGGASAVEIPATLNTVDRCPKECVGYAEYRKLPSAFDLVKNPSVSFLHDPDDDTSAFFIPSKAAQCSIDGAGCEEFTNVEAPSAGGERKAYFTYARACEKPSAKTKTYFTWEGSDVSGYQLRTWALIREAKDPKEPAEPPKILRKAGQGGIVKDPLGCSEATWKTGIDPDCRQFYDEKGSVSYRYFSQTIVSSPECTDFRKNNSNTSDCTKTGGDPRKKTGECIYHILSSQSATCPAQQAGCRGYLGTTGRNTTTVLRQSFISPTSTAGFSSSDKTVKLNISNEALLVGDHSLKLSNTSEELGSSVTASISFSSAAGSLYTASFWAKTTDAKRRIATLQIDGKPIGTFAMEVDWKRYELGPFQASIFPMSTLTWINLPHVTFLDEVDIQRLQDIVYVKKDSWTIPAVCDQTAQGIPQPQAMLGCREYRDRLRTVVDVRQFSRLCRFESVGCTAYVDTRNSVDPYSQSFVLPGLTSKKAWDKLYADTITVTRPADRYVYAIDEPRVRCDAAMASCRAFGKPKLTPFWTLDTKQPFETVYLKDDITKYVDGAGEPKMLCRPSELFCDRFVSGQTTSYFRDPGDHACEWRNRLALQATSTVAYSYPKGEYSGWFVKGIDPPRPCYPEKLSRGNTFLVQYAGAADTRGWTGLCPRDQSECTEFRDTNDRTDQTYPQGKPYFFINNDRLDKTSCNGKVDLLSGCILFRDMNNSQLTFNSAATYAKFQAESGNPQSPINCVTDATNPYCKRMGRCVDVKEKSSTPLEGSIKHADEIAFITKTTGAVCSADSNCAAIGITCTDKLDSKERHNCLESDKECRSACNDVAPIFRWEVSGRCELPQKNDSNTIINVRLDRDCKTWLGCSSGETVYDQGQGKYVDLCTNLSVCDQGLGASGKQFCAHYIDRRPGGIKQSVGGEFREPVLQEGAFVNLLTYANRPVGFGEADYSGYVLPNHFSIADVVTRRVGYELLSNRSGAIRNKFYTDYRLVAATPLYVGTFNPAAGPDLARKDVSLESPYGAVRYNDPIYPHLNLCQHKQTGQIGYFVGDASHIPTENPRRCYFAVDTPYTSNVAEVGGSSVNPRNAQILATQFEQLQDLSLSQPLNQAFPPPECKAHPDSRAPFQSVYVKEWDFASDPPKPTQFASGYSGAPYCEFGEDCACSYRKVSYSGIAKYYAPLGQSPPSGICVGGSRDGEGCIPDAVISQFVPTSTTRTKQEEGSLKGSEQLCGSGGTCQPIQSISFIRGIYGQCLQRDSSRTVAGSQAYTSCLVWNPTPVLFGQRDIYHYQLTAGYLPPANAGEYYCVASAQPPKAVEVTPSTAAWLASPGNMEDHKFHYDDAFVSDGNCVQNAAALGAGLGSVAGPYGAAVGLGIGAAIGGCTGSDARFIDGVKAEGGAMGDWCEQADDDQDNGGHGVDGRAGRWVMTGRGRTHSYAEYFIGFNAKTWAQWLSGGLPGAPGSDLDALFERNFSYFSFSPITNPNGNGRIGCGYSHVWAESPVPDNYNSLDETKKKDREWLTYFNRTFKKTISRESQDFLRTEKGDKLLKLPCHLTSSHAEDDDSGCYYKFWELGYRDEGESKFKMQWDDHGGPKKFGKGALYFEEAQSAKPFFAIRAMFEDANTAENKIDANDTKKMPANGNRLAGPFRFVGWWVTAAVPGGDSEHALYMYLNIGHADICKEVAQVIAPDTRESVAYQDRLWQPAGFSVPRLGYTFYTTNEPFGSAKHTRPIGADPLFQVRGPMPGVQSKLRPPTFIAAGSEYVGGGKTPTANWAWLSNLFARVYRMYRFYDQPVTKDSWACVYGPKFGTWCPDVSDKGDAEREAISQRYCGYAGTCTGIVNTTKPLGLCNAFSGVNAGLLCSGDVSDQIEGYHACHNAPLQKQGGNLVPLYKACELQDKALSVNPEDGKFYTWSRNTTGSTYYPCTDPAKIGKPGCEGRPRAEAVKQGALRCARGSVGAALEFPKTSEFNHLTYPTVTCNKPTTGPSTECPAMVVGGPKVEGSAYIFSQCFENHCNNGFKHAQCNDDKDCEFTLAQWWGAYNAGKPYADRTLNYTSQGGVQIKSGYGYSTTPYKVSWWSNRETVAPQVSPGTGDAKYASFIAAGNKGENVHVDIGGQTLSDGAFVSSNLKDPRIKRFPGAYAASFSASELAFIPSHCERAPESDAAIKAFIGEDVNKAHVADRPYAPRTYFNGLVAGFKSSAPGYVPEGFTRYYGDPKEPWKEATCEGGALEGRRCTREADCVPTGVEELQKSAKQFCKPVSVGIPRTPASGEIALSSGSEKWSCQAPSGLGDPKSENVDLDDNLCTHSAGYYPRADLCGEDSNRPQCLTAITQSNPISIDPMQTKSLPPTDVTSGFYAPKFLADAQKSAGILGPSPSEFKDADYRYISYYTPRPPTIAAPDTTRQCPTAGSCSISQLDAFSIEHQSEGNVAFFGGRAMTTMRFYGWAADNQAPLKDLWVDWGDTHVQEYHDARIKNKKPFCGVSKECQFVPGLTCTSDTACPPGGGRCVDTGFCKTRPYIQCQRDEDCSTPSSIVKDQCIVRVTFGNSDLACEQNFFEFSHAYICGIEQRMKLPECDASKRCARNNELVCTSDAACGLGDRCVAGLAQPGGCFDKAKAACRFTPRVLLKDNWGWCTGDCRVQDIGGGKLGGGLKGPAGTNSILLPNGGCYDGSRAYQNTDTKQTFIVGTAGGSSRRDMCAPDQSSAVYKPWMVYRGAVQVGITQ